ncbi:MAG: hypothetical protein ACRC2H_06775 [Silanimonas sp.]
MAINDDLKKTIRDAPVTVVRPTAASFNQKPPVSFIEPQDINEFSPRPRAPGESRGSQLLRDARYGFTPEGQAKQFRENFPNATTAAPAAALPRPGIASEAPARAAGGGSQALPVAAAAAAPTAALARPAAPSGTPGVQFNTGQPGDVQPPTQPNIGYFTGSDGKRRDITGNQADALAARVQSVPGAAPAPTAPAPVLARPAVDPMALAGQGAAGQRGEAAATRRDAESFLNPMSASAEAMRRLENAQGSYFNKGSPSARAFAAEAILGQLRAGNAASATRQQQIGETLQQGAAGAVDVGQQAATLEDARDARQTTATLRREEMDASAPVLQLAGGTAGRVGRDGVVRTLVGEDGAPARAAQQANGLDPTEVFKAAAAQRGDIANNPLLDPETRAAALAEFDAGPLGQALAAALPSSPQGAGASRPSFDQLKAANPNVSDAELRDYYSRTYGTP